MSSPSTRQWHGCVTYSSITTAIRELGRELEDFFASAETCSEASIGVPDDQAVTGLNNAFDPFTLFTAVEGPIGQGIQTLLDDTGIQADILNPILGLIGPLGGLFTS